jgi:GH15 family glucan-1,4-alpha-glucosidase
MRKGEKKVEAPRAGAAPLSGNYQAIENYGVIGDLHTAALVSMEGSIDFMCFPRFDSPTIFASLLDCNHGGHFQIVPAAGEFKRRQRYLPDTNILLTRFLGTDGVANVSDFMPLPHLGYRQGLIRRAKVVRGEIRFRMVCAPRFDYGRQQHTVEKKPGEYIFSPKSESQPALRLRTSVGGKLENGAVTSEFVLRHGESATFILEDANAKGNSTAENPDYVSEAFKQTMNYWLGWVGRSQYHGRWREMVNRSALTLKLLTSLPHGSLVAAPTFGLPERIGGERNWDYRYTWIRDGSFSLYALMRLGYMEEATRFMEWIEQRCCELGRGQTLQVMYRIDGTRDLPEKILRNFPGYQNSKPVRIGNGASDQLQLDIYGELLDSVFFYDMHGGPISYDFWMHLTKLVEWVCRNWRKPDEGIWEERAGRHVFLYSRVLCWVALDRAIQLARRRSFPAPLVRWHRIRDEIYKDVYRNFWNPKLKAFVQSPHGKAVDASALLLPLVRFISPSDPRWRSTLEAIEKTLVEDSLVYRYKTPQAWPDGLSGSEGTFSMCSFWYVECLARAGDLKKARFIFEKALGYSNHLGLYAEQLGPCGEHLGNFPQALSHIALISAAWTLDKKLSETPALEEK